MTFRQFAYRNVVRNARIYAAFFMASVISVVVFFLYSMLFYHPAIENKFLREIAVLGMGIAEIILYIFTLFFLFYSMRAFLQARSKEFGILLHLGMEKKQLNKLIFFETMIIGCTAIAVGTVIGFVFSKFFFMIVREIVELPTLPLYLSWQPFALTIGAFLSLFIIISFIAPVFIRSGKIVDLLHGETTDENPHRYSKIRGYLGVLLLFVSYLLAALTSNKIVVGLVIFLPPLATVGTYFFFRDSVPLFLNIFKGHKRVYWRNFRLLSISDSIVSLRENARMFFIVTIVSTIAFMSVGTLASLTSFASQYRELNPLGLTYISEQGNRFEEMHVAELESELTAGNIAYDLVKFPVLQQISSFKESSVDIVRLSDVNHLAEHLGYSTLQLKQGQALFLPPTVSSFRTLDERTVFTTLDDSEVEVIISGAYPHHLFPAYTIGVNAIVLNDEDFSAVQNKQEIANQSAAYMYYAFHIPDWQRTKDIGLLIDASVSESIISGGENALPYTFENPGLNYSIIRMTFSLILFIGLLLAVVFFLATGSFIYFHLYTRLDHNRKQFEVLHRLGLTNRELKKIVNRQLIPQFFFPWCIALLHSAFAFLSLQVIWDSLAEISIAKELILVLSGFSIMQLLYFYLIRWRYLVHIRAPG